MTCGEAAGGAVLGDEGEVEEDRALCVASHSAGHSAAAEPGRAERRAFRSRRPLGSAVAEPSAGTNPAVVAVFARALTTFSHLV